MNVFSADKTDIKWMTELYLQSVREHHFDIDLSSVNNNILIKRTFKSLVKHQCIPACHLQAQTLVFEYNGIKVGYIVMAAVRNQPSSIEINLFIVDRRMRGKNYGKQMLNEVIQRWHPEVTIYARCFPASWIMKSMLEKSGFCNIAELSDSSTLLALYHSSWSPGIHSNNSIISSNITVY